MDHFNIWITFGGQSEDKKENRFENPEKKLKSRQNLKRMKRKKLGIKYFIRYLNSKKLFRSHNLKKYFRIFIFFI